MPEEPNRPERRVPFRLTMPTLALCAALATPDVAAAETADVRTFQVPAEVERPCLSYSMFGDTRMLVARALVASIEAQVSPSDSAAPDVDPQRREASRLLSLQASAAAVLLASGLARDDADGCQVIASSMETTIGVREQGRFARWLLDGHVAVRVGDEVVTTVRHRPQRDLPGLPTRSVTGGFRGLTADGKAVAVLAMPPILTHQRWYHDPR